MTVGTVGHILPLITVYVYRCGLKRVVHLSFSFCQLASRQGNNINANVELSGSILLKRIRAPGKNITGRRSYSFSFKF